MDPTKVPVRQYLLRSLNAWLFVEAAGLTDATLASIEKLSGSQPSFRLFIDTNVMFSILNLHENPYNEAALSIPEGEAVLSFPPPSSHFPPSSRPKRKDLREAISFLEHNRGH
jgi:hypothetical protein